MYVNFLLLQKIKISTDIFVQLSRIKCNPKKNNGKQRYFRPVLFSPFFTANRFDPSWIRPVVFNERYSSLRNSPSPKFARWQRGERGENKSGEYFPVYSPKKGTVVGLDLGFHLLNKQLRFIVDDSCKYINTRTCNY